MRPLPLFLPLIILLPGCVLLSAPDTEGLDGPDVVVVPTMRERPVLDMELSAKEWADARVVEGEFVIADGTAASGTYPLRVRLGADANALHLAVELPDLPPNPFWGNRSEGGAWYPDDIVLFFLMDHEGPLAPPADMIRMWYMPGVGSGTDDGYWTGGEWVFQSEGPQGGPFNDGRPAGRWSRANTTADGTVFWEVHIPRLSDNREHNALQLGPRAPFRMGLLFDRQGDSDNPENRSPDGRGLIRNPHDVYPGDGYTPHGHYDPATWLKLRMGT